MAEQDMKASNIGIVNELRAITWLLENNWEVFNNVKPNGPADIIAWDPKTDKTIKIDVKTVTRHERRDGGITYMFSGIGKTPPNTPKPFVKYLGYCESEARFIWLDEIGV